MSEKTEELKHRTNIAEVRQHHMLFKLKADDSVVERKHDADLHFVKLNKSCSFPLWLAINNKPYTSTCSVVFLGPWAESDFNKYAIFYVC